MKQKKKVQLNLNINEEYRNHLRTMAAERMLQDPTQTYTASGIAADIVADYLDQLKKQEEKENL